VKTKTGLSHRTTSSDEQRLYDHLLACVSSEPPDVLLERFQALFIDGFGYADREVVEALDHIVLAPDVDEYFRYVLNRCCHILINRWQSHPQLQQAIPPLVALFESSPARRSSEYSRSRAIRRLRQMTGDFLESDQYLALRRLSRVVEGRQARQAARSQIIHDEPLGTLINRYPYLYEHCLVTEDSDLQHQRLVRTMQVEAQRQFEVNLSQYVTYRVRRARLQRQGQTSTIQNLRIIPNPTLLADRELVSSIKQFSRRQDHGQSYQDAAQRFMMDHQQGKTFRRFKEDLLGYIIDEVDQNYASRQFNTLLQEHLFNTYQENDNKPLNDFLMVRTCSNLFNFLVVDPSTGRQHFVFIDLINNLGPVNTTGLLLRILLICHKVKPFLERRFSILFNHYETVSSDTVSWLVQVLENINIALSLNFGNVDLSHTSRHQRL
jgi:hypothetical protein